MPLYEKKILRYLLASAAIAALGGKMNKTKKVVVIGVLIAIQVVLSRFVTIPTVFNRIGPSFIVAALSGSVFGPIVGLITSGLSDIIGATLFPQGGAPFPGFTVSSMISGLIYGIVLHREDLKPWHIVLSCVLVGLIPNFLMNSYWLHILKGEPLLVVFGYRLVPAIGQVVIKSIVLVLLLPKLKEVTKRSLQI